MAKVKATQRFSVVVMHDGTNVYVRAAEGESLDLDPALVDLVNRDGKLLVADNPKPKQTRQVKKAPNRKGS